MHYKPKSSDEIRRNMSAIRAKENRTEVRLRKELFSRGLRYRKYVPGLFGKPDIVFSGPKVAVFVDGDFWHGRVLRERGPEALRQRLKTKNRGYWERKLTRRVERDDEVTEQLGDAGWTVLRYWESEVKEDLEGTADEIEQVVRGRQH